MQLFCMIGTELCQREGGEKPPRTRRRNENAELYIESIYVYKVRIASM